MRKLSKKSLFNFQPAGKMDPDVAKVFYDLKQICKNCSGDLMMMRRIN